MRLVGERAELRLVPRAYQFDSATDWDESWLMVEVDVSTEQGSWSFVEPCLRAEEARSLASWLEHVASPDSPPEPLGFIEPVLSFEVVERGEPIVVRVFFEIEARPPWARDVEWGACFADLAIPAEALVRASRDLRRELKPIPPRGDLLVAIALAVTAAGLVAWFAAVALRASGTAVAAGVTLFGMGALMAGAAAFAAARRAGVGVGRSLLRGAKTLLGWVVAFLP